MLVGDLDDSAGRRRKAILVSMVVRARKQRVASAGSSLPDAEEV